MKICGKVVVINDQATLVFGRSVPNNYVSLFFGTLQLAVATASLAQHVFSVAQYKLIFNCQFNASFRNDAGRFLGYDIIIYDYGLFNFVLGTDECVANYLDGGYMRCLWCISHMTSLIVMIVSIFMKTKTTLTLWPILVMQSVYSLGLIILALATLPKLLHAFVNRMTPRFLGLTSIYFGGTAVNWFFTFAVWHYNWHLESVEKQRRKQIPMRVLHRMDVEEDETDSRQETAV